MDTKQIAQLMQEHDASLQGIDDLKHRIRSIKLDILGLLLESEGGECYININLKRLRYLARKVKKL